MSARTKSSRNRISTDDVSVDDLESELDQLISPSYVDGQLQPPSALPYARTAGTATSTAIPSRLAIKQLKSTSVYADEYPEEWDGADLVAFGGGTHSTALIDSDEEISSRRPLNGTLQLNEDDMQFVKEVNAGDDGSWVFIDGVYKKVALNDKALRPPPLVPENTSFSLNKRKPHAMLRPDAEADQAIRDLESKLSGLRLERNDIVAKADVQQADTEDSTYEQRYASEREERRRRRRQKQTPGLRAVDEEETETVSSSSRSKRSSMKGNKKSSY